MGRRYDTISLLSDSGAADEFAGVVKAIVRDLAAHVTVIDLTHGVPPFDVRGGSLTLARCVSYLPSGVVVAVVDPGVGTDRKPIAIEVAGGEGVFVGPDNGLLAPAVAMVGGAGRAVVLSNVEWHLGTPSAVTAGRDVFAPVAAHLCNGVDLDELGERIDADELMPGVVPLSREDGDALIGEVLWVDRYGNCQLNIGPDEIQVLGDRLELVIGESTRVAAVVSAFADVGPGAVGVLVDGSGLLCVVLDQRSAADELGAAAGDLVTIRALPGGDGVGTTSPVTLSARR